MKALKLLFFLLAVGLAGFAASATVAGTQPTAATTTALVCNRATPCTPEQCAQVGAHGLDCVSSTYETTTVPETTTEHQTTTEDETTTEQTTTRATTTTPPPGPPTGCGGKYGKDGQPGNDDCAAPASSTTTTTPATQTTTSSTTTTTAGGAGTTTAATSPPSSNESGNLGASTTVRAQPAAGRSLPFTGSRTLVIATLLGIALVAAGIALRTLRD